METSFHLQFPLSLYSRFCLSSGLWVAKIIWHREIAHIQLQGIYHHMIDLLYDCYCNKRLKTFETFIASAFDTSPLQALNKSAPNSKNVKTRITFAFQWKWKNPTISPFSPPSPPSSSCWRSPPLCSDIGILLRLPPDPIGRGRRVFFNLSRLHPVNSRAGAPPS